jgi:hypothetical protein
MISSTLSSNSCLFENHFTGEILFKQDMWQKRPRSARDIRLWERISENPLTRGFCTEPAFFYL